MGTISKDKNQVKLYYNSNDSIGKQTLGYAKASEKEFLGIDISKDKVTGTQWAELAEGLGIKISDLINKTHPDFKSVYGKEELVMEDHNWLKILDKQPNTLAFPIAVVGQTFHAIKSPSEFEALMDPDSAGLKKPYNKE